ncbi:GIY-YIG nuclease family protein [Cochleicola gelatinilyticus]|uniref:Excinuclease ABC subunit C n=1 Tax=Cochleicola gelatinilyticus TaxID=1763537 RepID=A0A167J4I4_9FLAO|nr:GIY-YIG nuclease family protein [Cochleicola gelatinilyticus]OAB80331.1 excinuclease ABC subunit C [Cochleicola gelatinilyticus]
MKLYFTYILLCSDNSYYTGMTNDIERRVEEHIQGKKKSSYTYARRPVELKWFVTCTNPSEAIKIEKQIKGWTHRKKKALIEENAKDLIRFSKNYKEFGKPK